MALKPFSWFWMGYWTSFDFVMMIQWLNRILIQVDVHVGFMPNPQDRHDRDRMVVGFTTTFVYLCNQCRSPLKLWDQSPFMGRCTWYNIMW